MFSPYSWFLVGTRIRRIKLTLKGCALIKAGQTHDQACSNRAWILLDLPPLRICPTECSIFKLSMCPTCVFCVSPSLPFMYPHFVLYTTGIWPFLFCFQKITGSVFYLILDIVDTECHVFSKKLWKNCMARFAHTIVRILFSYLISNMMSYSGTTDDSKIPTQAFLVGSRA